MADWIRTDADLERAFLIQELSLSEDTTLTLADLRRMYYESQLEESPE